jgi:ribosomal subunit interface protein
MIPIKIKTTGAVLLNEEVREYLEEKVQKLSKFTDMSDTTMLMDVELEALPKKTGENFRTELNFSSNGKVLRAEARGETLHASIDEAVEEAARRLKHLKGKHLDIVRRAGAEVKEFFRNFPGF